MAWHRDNIKTGVAQFITKAEMKPFNDILQPDYKNWHEEGGEGKKDRNTLPYLSNLV